MLNFEDKIKEIENQRGLLRGKLIIKMRDNPTLKDSETLRLVENDISFWAEQKDRSVKGLIDSIQKSLNLK